MQTATFSDPGGDRQNLLGRIDTSVDVISALAEAEVQNHHRPADQVEASVDT